MLIDRINWLNSSERLLIILYKLIFKMIQCNDFLEHHLVNLGHPIFLVIGIAHRKTMWLIRKAHGL